MFFHYREASSEHTETAITEQTHMTQCLSGTHFRNLTVDDPEIIQKITTFHEHLAALENTLCSVCLECFPSIKTNEAAVCKRCQGDNELPILYSAANNMDPGPIPPELCVSSTI